MSKPDENNTPTNSKDAPGDNPPATQKGLLTIEEHAKNLEIDAPVFAAVIQAKGWAAGKKIPTEDFAKAVEEFLKGSMGGK